MWFAMLARSSKEGQAGIAHLHQVTLCQQWLVPSLRRVSWHCDLLQISGGGGHRHPPQYPVHLTTLPPSGIPWNLPTLPPHCPPFCPFQKECGKLHIPSGVLWTSAWHLEVSFQSFDSASVKRATRLLFVGPLALYNCCRCIKKHSTSQTIHFSHPTPG